MKLSSITIQDQAGHILVQGATDRITEAVSGINVVIKELRNYISSLNHAEGGTIRQALLREIVRLHSHGIREVKTDFDDCLTAEQDLGLYSIERALHECVSNIIRHSEATAVSLSIKCNSNCISLSIKDNGIGNNPGSSVMSEGLGYQNIRARLSALGGDFILNSQLAGNYCVTLRVPSASITPLIQSEIVI